METKELILNIRRWVLKAPKFKRAKKAVKVVRELVMRHAKAKIVKISARLNMYLWSRGIKNPPTKFKVRIIKKDDVAYVDLAEPKSS